MLASYKKFFLNVKNWEIVVIFFEFFQKLDLKSLSAYNVLEILLLESKNL